MNALLLLLYQFFVFAEVGFQEGVYHQLLFLVVGVQRGEQLKFLVIILFWGV